MLKMSKLEFAITQSIRLASNESTLMDGSIDDLVNDAINDDYSNRNQYPLEQFHCVILLDGDYHHEDLQKVKDLKEKVNSSRQLSILHEIGGYKWVFISGDYVGRVFDLSDSIYGKSNIMFGAALHRIINLLNKSTDGEVWVDGDKRGILKDCRNPFKLLLLECRVESGYPHKGYAYINEITVDLHTNSVSSKSMSRASIEACGPVLSLDEILRNLDSGARRRNSRSRDYSNRDAR